MPFNRENMRKKRQLRVRNKLKKSADGRLRLSVYKSLKNIYAQIIDDASGNTLASASTLEKSLGLVGKNMHKIELSHGWFLDYGRLCPDFYLVLEN